MKEILESEVRRHGGVPTLFINGKPETGLMHWNRFPTPADVEIFRNGGVHLYSFMGCPPIREQPDIPAVYDDGRFAVPELSHEFIDETFSMLEKADPECKVLVRLRITPPLWWREKHPDALTKSYEPHEKEFLTSSGISVCDPEWHAEVEKSLRETIVYLEEHWGHRIFGYHPGMAACAENAHAWGNVISDFSASSLQAFRQWLPGRYAGISALNAVWHKEYTSFAEVEFPDPAVYFSGSIADDCVFTDPVSAQCAVDFQDFNSDIMADTVIFQARIVKDTLRSLGRKKICGAFYGYMIPRSDELSPLCCGHMALSKVLASPDVDMLCAPLGYGSRQPGGAALSQFAIGTAILHGKLFYTEEDTRLHLAAERPESVSDTLAVSENILYRSFYSTWRSGATLWWMDLFGQGWYRDPGFSRIIASCRTFAENHSVKRESIAQIAFFISEKGVACERSMPDLITGAAVSQQLMELSMCGAPYDIYRLEDLPELVRQDRLKQYRFAIVASAHRLDDELRAGIENDLKKDGRSILWLYAPDIRQKDGFSTDAVSTVTGISVAEIASCSFLTETRLDGHRITYGMPQNLSPRLTCCDPDAEVLGWYMEGTKANNRVNGLNGGSFVRKRFADWTSIWSCSPGVPSEWLRTLAEAAGVHIYSDCGLQIFAAENWLAATAGFSGEYTISLPDKHDPICVTMERGETRVWDFAE